MPDQDYQNNKSQLDNNKNDILFAVSALLISFIYTKLKIYDGVLIDAFHRGEYFAALSSILHDVDFSPLIIHGALDFVPGMIAEFFYGRDQYFLATRLLYLGFDLLTAILFLLLIKKYTISRAQIVLAGFILPYFVGYRDFSMYLLTFLFLASYEINNSKKYLLLQVLLGLAAAFNFYWSTNRGLAGTLTFGFICLLLAVKRKEYFISLTIFFLSVMFVSYFFEIVNIKHYLENLIFLTQTSYQWSYELSPETIFLKTFMLFLLFSANFLIIHHSITYRANYFHALMFVLLSVFYMQMSTYRADIAHIYMGMPIYMLALSYWYFVAANKIEDPGKYENILLRSNILIIVAVAVFYKSKPLMLVSIYCIVLLYQTIYWPSFFKKYKFNFVNKYGLALLFLIFVVSIFSNYRKGAYEWVWMYESTPTNNMLTTDGINWVADELKKVNVTCVFDLTNNGVINGLVDLPACTRFSYIIYADNKYEDELIDSLKVLKPPAIVYSTKFWSYSIDDKSMVDRFPDLDKFIKQNYQYEKCENDYCIRYLNKPV